MRSGENVHPSPRSPTCNDIYLRAQARPLPPGPELPWDPRDAVCLPLDLDSPAPEAEHAPWRRRAAGLRRKTS